MSDAAAAAPAKRGQLDDLMLAMDVVDTLRHREDLVARELNDAGKQDDLIERLRALYRAQGIDVPDHILREGVKGLKDSRFVLHPAGAGPEADAGDSLREPRPLRQSDPWTFGRDRHWLGVWQFGVVGPSAKPRERRRSS